MFQTEDNTYNDLRKKSLEQWLNEMENHDDIAVRGGIRLVREYIAHLEENADRLTEANALKDKYLKKYSKR